MKYSKIKYQDGGYIIVPDSVVHEYTDDPDFECVEMATFKEIRAYQEHQKFMKFADKYMVTIEDFDSERPGMDEKFRYSKHDMLNLITMLVKKEKPDIKRVQK